jgi:hypothetical protein
MSRRRKAPRFISGLRGIPLPVLVFSFDIRFWFVSHYRDFGIRRNCIPKAAVEGFS